MPESPEDLLLSILADPQKKAVAYGNAIDGAFEKFGWSKPYHDEVLRLREFFHMGALESDTDSHTGQAPRGL